MPKVDRASETGLDQNPLSDSESRKLQRALNRSVQDVSEERAGVLYDELQDYSDEINVAARVAKAQFDKEFDGLSPTSGSFGLDRIHAGYFGYDTWFNVPDATESNLTTFLDNGAPDNLNGAGGQQNPLTIGEPVVHLVVGFGDYSQSPKANRVRVRLNDSPRTAVSLNEAFFGTETHYQMLDTPVLLKDDDDVYAQFHGAADGAHALYPIGLTFIEAKDYREIDPAEMAGTDASNIVVE